MNIVVLHCRYVSPTQFVPKTTVQLARQLVYVDWADMPDLEAVNQLMSINQLIEGRQTVYRLLSFIDCLLPGVFREGFDYKLKPTDSLRQPAGLRGPSRGVQAFFADLAKFMQANASRHIYQ